VYDPESVALKTRKSSTLEKFISFCLIALVCLAPLPLGSNRPLAWSILSLVSGGLLILWALGVATNKIQIKVSLKHAWKIVVPFVLVMIWAFLQTKISAETVASPLWKIAGDVLHTTLDASITPDRYKTLDALMRLIAYGSSFWIALQLGRSTTTAYRILKAILIAGGVYASYGMIDHFSGSEHVLFFPKEAYIGSVTATFINRNSYATYAAICCIICLAFLVNKVFLNVSSEQENASLKQVAHNFYTKGFVYLHLLILLLASLILTNSRAGVFSFAIGLLVFIFCIGQSRPMQHLRKTIYITLTAMVILLSGFVLQGGGNLLDRFNTIDNDIAIRKGIYKITLNAIGDFRYFGSGLGSFEQVFNMYNNGSLPKTNTARVDHAHNTYLEMMLEVGVIAFSILMLSFIFINASFIKGLERRKKDYIFPLTGLATSVVVGTHAFFDFSLEMPAIALTYSVIIGVCLAQSWSTRDDLGDKNNRKFTIASAAITGLIIFVMGISYSLNEARQLESNYIISKIMDGKEVSEDELKFVIKKKSESRDNNPTRLNYLGIAEFELAFRRNFFTTEGENLLNDAQKHLQASLAISPANSFAWERLAYIGLIFGVPYEDTATYIYTSIMTSPYDMNLLFPRLELSMMVWDYFSPTQQDLLIAQISAAARIDAKRTEAILKPYNLFLD
jgi:O-antigen ligase